MCLRYPPPLLHCHLSCRRDRERARSLCQPGRFIEVYMKVRAALLTVLDDVVLVLKF
jgi:adenylylsulfate kinase-like enzyme